MCMYNIILCLSCEVDGVRVCVSLSLSLTVFITAVGRGEDDSVVVDGEVQVLRFEVELDDTAIPQLVLQVYIIYIRIYGTKHSTVI